VTKSFLDSGGSLDARLAALASVASLVEWPLPRERDARACAEFAGVLDKLFAMLAHGEALDRLRIMIRHILLEEPGRGEPLG